MKANEIILISTATIFLVMLPFFLRLEHKKLSARKLVLISIMTAVAAAGRCAFFFIPQFKPIIAVVILCGIAFGAQAGFLCGALSMLISNFVFGQGPWTPWQMFACGTIGIVSGLFSNSRLSKNIIFLSVFGFLSGLLYGMLADVWTLIALDELTLSAVLTILSVGLIFNLILAFATVVFLLIAAKPFLKMFDRIKLKYGI